ncbi:MAG TPA: hypothetical protein VFU37_23370, partial [Pyrinomonadaceae bacterium]|nr:hypothetical protein [Pyrinomonadaceae bacterium]
SKFPGLTGLGNNGSLPPADALPSDTRNTVVKNAIRLDLDSANMLFLILCIIHLLRNESH